MQESTSLLILWLLSSLKQERSTLCLIQMLECPAAQAEIALHRVTADGLAEQRDETWNLTQAGADHLREALPALLFRDTGSPLEELISACESKMPETACEICTKRMRVLRRRADTAGSAGYLELLLNQLAQWQNRRLTAPEARSLRPLCLCRPRRLPLLYEERGPLLRLHEKGRRIRRLRRG